MFLASALSASQVGYCIPSLRRDAMTTALATSLIGWFKPSMQLRNSTTVCALPQRAKLLSTTCLTLCTSLLTTSLTTWPGGTCLLSMADMPVKERGKINLFAYFDAAAYSSSPVLRIDCIKYIMISATAATTITMANSRPIMLLKLNRYFSTLTLPGMVMPLEFICPSM